MHVADAPQWRIGSNGTKNTMDVNSLSKAELNAALATPLTASQLKKTPIATLRETVRRELEETLAIETLLDERNGLDDKNELIPIRKAPAPKAKKPTRHQPRTITVEPRGEVKPFKPGTIQAQVADMLRGGATIGDLRRACVKRDGTIWLDSAIKGLFTLDIRAKGYGVRTELWNGFQMWQNCSWDDTTFVLGRDPRA